MTTTLIISIDETIDERVLYYSILEVFRDFGYIVNDNKGIAISHIHNRIKYVKDVLWSKIRYYISLLKIPCEQSLVLMQIHCIKMSNNKIAIRLRYER